MNGDDERRRSFLTNLNLVRSYTEQEVDIVESALFNPVLGNPTTKSFHLIKNSGG